jgi:cell division septation protein DedD
VRIIENDIPKTAGDGYKQIASRGKKMKSTRPPLFKTILFLAGVSCFFFAAAPKAPASAADQIDNALVASKTWVAQIDAGQYDESYAFGCGAMHDKVPESRWEQVLKTLRTPWGPVVSRRQISHIYKPNGVPGLEGECVVITYDTTFQKLGPATEEIVLKWENGKWRGAGYTAEPQPPPDDGSAPPPPTSTTETHTDTHVTPPPQ